MRVHEPSKFDYTPGLGISVVAGGAVILVGSRMLMRKNGIEVPEDSAGPSSGVYVARDGGFIGSIVVGDTTRPEAKRAVEAFDRMGITSILLTGDSRQVADAVAREIGINEVEADVLPEQKRERVRSLVASGRVVAMVGDGINDAPALAEASVGVAMGSGTDVARETGGVVLIGNDLVRLAKTLQIARWTRRVIWQNFAGTIAVDVGGMVLAAAGLLNPALAAFIHVASELAFLLNSARLLPR